MSHLALDVGVSAAAAASHPWMCLSTCLQVHHGKAALEGPAAGGASVRT